jgi:hypothetical protein
MFINDFILKIKRAETPFYARLKRIGQAVLTLQLPIPRFLDPIYKVILYFRYLRYETSEKLSVAFFRYPVMRMLCESVGKRLRMRLQEPKIPWLAVVGEVADKRSAVLER